MFQDYSRSLTLLNPNNSLYTIRTWKLKVKMILHCQITWNQYLQTFTLHMFAPLGKNYMLHRVVFCFLIQGCLGQADYEQKKGMQRGSFCFYSSKSHTYTYTLLKSKGNFQLKILLSLLLFTPTSPRQLSIFLKKITAEKNHRISINVQSKPWVIF